MHRLGELLDEAARGRFPAIRGDVELHPPDAMGTRAVVEFTGHSVVLSDAPAERLRALGVDGFGGASHPNVLLAIAGEDADVGTHDAVLVATGAGGGRLPRRDDLEGHPRVRRARHHRRDVAVYGDEHGLVTIGFGLVGRREVSIERFERAPTGTGGRLIRESLALTPRGETVFAQVAPGNAASLRAFLREGFVPIGAETLITPRSAVR